MNSKGLFFVRKATVMDTVDAYIVDKMKAKYEKT
jgi:hypothetical protein